MTTLVIDGDLVAYRCAAANEERFVTATHNNTLEEIEFSTATQFKQWAGSKADNYTLKPGQRAKPEAFAYKSIRDFIYGLVEQVGAKNYHICVSGKGNFRDDLPLPTKYKGKRDKVSRPLLLKDCKGYLLDSHHAEVSSGKEADDLLAGYAYQGRNDKSVIVATIDKDQMGCEGWVFDWTKMTEPFLVKGFGELRIVETPTGKTTAKGTPVVEKDVKGHGKIWLLHQCLMGDSADDYRPYELAKVQFGQIGSYEILKHCKTQEEAFKAVLNKYRLWYPEPVIYRAWNGELHTKDAVEIFQMYADCAYMRKWDGDKFDVKKVMDAYGIN